MSLHVEPVSVPGAVWSALAAAYIFWPLVKRGVRRAWFRLEAWWVARRYRASPVERR